MSAKDKIAGYVRHAERYGTAQVYESAAEELGPTALGELSLKLQRIDKKWRLDRDLAGKLVVDLYGTVDDDRLMRMATLGAKAFQNVVDRIEWRAA